MMLWVYEIFRWVEVVVTAGDFGLVGELSDEGFGLFNCIKASGTAGFAEATFFIGKWGKVIMADKNFLGFHGFRRLGRWWLG